MVKSKYIWIGLGLVVILLGFILIPRLLVKDYSYNNFEFYKDKEGFWHTMINVNGRDTMITMYYHPREVENISIDPGIINVLYNPFVRLLYITMSPKAPSLRVVSAIELQKIVGNLLNKRTILGVTYLPENRTNKDITVIDCSNASLVSPVFYLVKTNGTTSVDVYGLCIVIHGSTEREILRAVNALDYRLLGITRWNTTIQSNQDQE